MYQYEKSRKAQLHENLFSWFWGIGGVHQQAKKAVNDERTSKYMEDQEKMENTKYDDKFYRLPKRLFKDDQFRSMTNEAKALYMILLDRRCLSECNGDAWRDEYGAIFIIFTIKETT